MICLNFLDESNESIAGRIPSCIEWIGLELDSRDFLLNMFSGDVEFSPEFIYKLGWTGLYAETDGQMDEGDELLLANILSDRGIQKVYASSRRDILNVVNDRFLGAVISFPRAEDFNALSRGWWVRSLWSDILEPLNLLWLGWEELFCFTWPLQFAIVQLREGEGSTILVAPPDFINEFSRRSAPRCDYQWRPWGLPLNE